MNCQEVMELMQRQLDLDLDAQEEERLWEHLEQCTDCAEMFERLQRLSHDLMNLPKVVPAYSLVDAILPRLDEIDRHNAAALESGAVHSSVPTAAEPLRAIPWTRRFGTRISWKLLGGVVAAGLVFGLFIFNTKSPLMDQADGLLQPGKSSETSQSAASTAAQQETFNDAASKENSATADNIGANPNTAVNGRSGAPVEPVQTEAPKATGGTGNVKDVEDRKHIASAEPSPGTGENTAPQPLSPDAKAGGSGPTEQPKASSAPAPDPTDSAAMKQNPYESQTPDGSTPAATPAPEYGPQALEDVADQPVAPSMKPKNKGDKPIYGITAMIPATGLTSSSGSYVAMIDLNKVVIQSAQTREAVFTSERIWNESATITLLEWTEEDKLSYQVESDGKTRVFVIDAAAKTESESKP